MNCFTYAATAQPDTAFNTSFASIDLNSETLNGLHKKYGMMQAKLDENSARLLYSMQAKENKLKRKIQHIDSSKARELFTDDVNQRYADLQTKLSATSEKLNQFPLKDYVPGLDSVQTSLAFLIQNPNLPQDQLEQLRSLSTRVQNLGAELQKTNDIQAFVREREAMLHEQLMNSGVGKQLTNINKQVYYYQARIAEYKELLNDKEKLKEKLLVTIRTLPSFQAFWQKYSYLAALFPVPANYGTAQALAGLQTRSGIQNLIAQRVGNGGGAGIDPQQYFQGQVDAAQAQLNQLKEKLNSLGNNSGSSDMTMPDFKPNEEKTKTFLQRLEYGFNLQTAPAYYALPATTDFALTLGYKLSDNKRFGIGGSYKLGMGSLSNIQLSSQGIGLRSYVDIKAKGSIWLSGGFEYNYLRAFSNIQDLRTHIDVWQRSALAGLSKQYKIGKKKEGNIQLLYDFLHNQQNPPGRALKFRVGWIF